jgi:hypothetical protein
MTAEIVDLAKYREQKNRPGKQTFSALLEAHKETSNDETAQACTEQRRENDNSEPI